MTQVQQLRREMEETGQQVYLEWRRHPVTELLFRWLAAKREELKELSVTGGVMGASFEEAAIRMSAAMGYADAMKDILRIEYVDLQEIGHD